MTPYEMKEDLLQIWEWHWSEFKTEFRGAISSFTSRYSGKTQMLIFLRIPESPKPVVLECDRIIKLSGVASYGLRRITFGGVRLKKDIKQKYVELFTEKFFLWRWAYKPAERFVGGVVDGREQGVMLIYTPEEETE